MSDLSEAFVYPVDRSVSTAGSKMLDRISVRDYIVEAEVGAFKVEHGIKQKIKVNVVLEILPHNAFESDNVDKVISYDSIVEAIDDQFSEERVNLLETLAERIAQKCLNDVRAARVFIRIEKLEKIVGGLGVEIVRENTRDLSRLRISHNSNVKVRPLPKVLSINQDLFEEELVLVLANRLKDPNKNFIILLSQIYEADEVQYDNVNDFYASLLTMDRCAWLSAKSHDRLMVADSRTELEWSIKNNLIPIWAPYNMYSKAINLEKKYCIHPRYMSFWLAAETGSDEIIEINGAVNSNFKSVDNDNPKVTLRSVSYRNFIYSDF